MNRYNVDSVTPEDKILRDDIAKTFMLFFVENMKVGKY